MAAWQASARGVALHVRVSPRASRDRIEGVETGSDGRERLRVRLTAPPDKGAANEALIALLAKVLRAPKSAFRLAAGQTSRSKTIDIDGDADDLTARLCVLIGDTA